MKELIGKGPNKVAAYMHKAGYLLYDCAGVENGYEAEYYKTAAGITISKVVITFSESWKVTNIA